MTQHKPKVLVTSAAGRTGMVAAQELLKRGFPVRALVRRDDARATRLRQAGAEVMVANQLDYRDLRQAMVGVQRAYHCPPFAFNLLHNATPFALAAEEARLEVVALMSGWNPHPSHPSALTREHWAANNVYRWLPGVDVIHVNPGVFAFPYLFSVPVMAHLGMFMAPFGDGLDAPPSNEDIERVAAAVLADPSKHIGRCYRPTGPELISPSDVADIVGSVLGRKVTYRDVPFSSFAKAARAMGFPLFEIANLRHYAEELEAGAVAIGAPTDHVERVTGHPPEDFPSIARRYIAAPELIAPGLRIGTKAGALAFVAKMLLTRVPDFERWERSVGLPQIQDSQLAHENPQWVEAAERLRLVLNRHGRVKADLFI